MDPKTGKPYKKEVLKHFSQPTWVFLIPFLILAGFLSVTFAESAASRSDPIKGDVRQVPYPVGALSPPIQVQRVIDGDSIELASGEKVRYIGIDTPEIRRRVGGRWIEVGEPYAKEAYQLNRELVEGKWVRLELDIEDHDRYGRLLAYVYTKSGSAGSMKLVNAEILKAGLARVMFRAPNIRYADLFHALQHEAQVEKRGMWKAEPSVFTINEMDGKTSRSLLDMK
jgi:micrococcal nuclease